MPARPSTLNPTVMSAYHPTHQQVEGWLAEDLTARHGIKKVYR